MVRDIRDASKAHSTWRRVLKALSQHLDLPRDRPIHWEIDMRIEARFAGRKKYYPGKVLAVHKGEEGQTLLDLKYDSTSTIYGE